jgi:hypothetical protein
MSSSDAQKSEVHNVTADASTSPTADADTRATANFPGQEERRQSPKIHPEPLTPDTVVLQDDSDDGGPVVIKSDDPDLNPPHVPQDPFPTGRVPQIDPPMPRRHQDD